jgi:hypothetical protein
MVEIMILQSARLPGIDYAGDMDEIEDAENNI